MLTHSLLANNIGIYLYSLTNNGVEIFNTPFGISPIIREIVQVSPDNSLAECVNSSIVIRWSCLISLRKKGTPLTCAVAYGANVVS